MAAKKKTEAKKPKAQKKIEVPIPSAWVGPKSLEPLLVRTQSLKFDPKNARAHGEANIDAILKSLALFGQQKPIVRLANGTVIAGNGMLTAARKMGWEKIAVVTFTGTEQQAKAYALADNRTAEMSTWDNTTLTDQLKELSAELFPIEAIGFDLSALDAMVGGAGEGADLGDYSKKIKTPVYTPTGEKPDVRNLVNVTKAKELAARIAKAPITDDEKKFLLAAAQRHQVFDYRACAEYYCHATPEMQSLMEDSALVIIDFKKAVEQGYVTLTRDLETIYKASYGDDGDGE